jgi:hypothetical protein
MLDLARAAQLCSELLRLVQIYQLTSRAAQPPLPEAIQQQ